MTDGSGDIGPGSGDADGALWIEIISWDWNLSVAIRTFDSESEQASIDHYAFSSTLPGGVTPLTPGGRR
jgi:hypothetical protein